jgi:hypothetical protein
MKKISIIAVLVLPLSLLLAGGLFASGMDKSSDDATQKSQTTLFQGAIPADKLVGMDVKNQAGKTIGSISGQQADASGDIRFLTVSTGGIMGMGEKEHLVPTGAFEPTAKADALVLKVDENLVKNAPAKTQDISDAEYQRELNEHYGQAPSWGGEEKAMPEKSAPKGNY